MSCYCDYEPAEFVHTSTHCARKQYQCIECGHLIQPGETYERVFGKWDGEVSTHITCEPCTDLRDSIAALGHCYSYGGLLLDYESYLDNDFQKATEVMHRHRQGLAARQSEERG